MKVSDHHELSNCTATRRDADRGGKEEVGMHEQFTAQCATLQIQLENEHRSKKLHSALHSVH